MTELRPEIPHKAGIRRRISPGRANTSKIGFTTDWRQRLKALRVGLPYLNLYVVIPTAAGRASVDFIRSSRTCAVEGRMGFQVRA